MTFTLPVDDELSLRLVEPRHAEMLYAFLDRNREHLRPFLVWSPSVKDVNEVRENITIWLRMFADTGCFYALIEHGNRPVGTICHIDPQPARGCVEIGFWIDTAHEGNGYITRAARALIDHTIETLGFRRVEIMCDEQNTRSRAVAERLGFTNEGTIRRFSERLDGQWNNKVVYSMLVDEWKARQL